MIFKSVPAVASFSDLITYGLGGSVAFHCHTPIKLCADAIDSRIFQGVCLDELRIVKELADPQHGFVRCLSFLRTYLVSRLETDSKSGITTTTTAPDTTWSVA